MMLKHSVGVNQKLTYHDCQKIKARYRRQRLIAFIALGVLALAMFALSGCSGDGSGPVTSTKPIVKIHIVTPAPLPPTPDPHVCKDSLICWP